MDPLTLPGYDVLGPLGSGGSADVWRARRRVDGLAVALKVVRPAGGDVSAALAEAGLLAALRHPHVVHLYDVLPVPAGGSGRTDQVVLVTQLAAGGSLAQVLTRRRLLSPGELVTVLHPVASALADLHGGGVVHGDLSPGNILFRSDGMPLLADLGTARVVGEHLLRGVGTGAQDGMVSPEVLEGFVATRESDVYQLGAIAWLALVGQVPGPGFDREPFAAVAPDLSPLLVDLVQRCLAPQPEDRPDADEVAAALLDVAAPEPVEVAPDADPVFGVTQRLRQAALDDAAEQPDQPAPWWRRLRPRPRGTSARERRARRGRRPGAHRATGRQEPAPRPPAGEGRAASTLVRVLTTVVALAVLGMLAVVLWPAGGLVPGSAAPAGHAPVVAAVESADDLPAPEPAAHAADAADGAVSAATSALDPGTGGAAADSDPAAPEAAELSAQVQSLLDRRATAWRSADPDLLQGVVAQGSPAEASERAALTRARSEGVTYPEVSFDLVDLELVRDAGDRVEVEAVVASSAIEARRGDEVVLASPAREDRVRLELTRDDGAWALASWDDSAR